MQFSKTFPIFVLTVKTRVIKKTSLVKQKKIVYACLMAPKKSDGTSKAACDGRCSVRVNPAILQRFRAFAERQRRSFSKELEIAMEERMERNQST